MVKYYVVFTFDQSDSGRNKEQKELENWNQWSHSIEGWMKIHWWTDHDEQSNGRLKTENNTMTVIYIYIYIFSLYMNSTEWSGKKKEWKYRYTSGMLCYITLCIRRHIELNWIETELNWMGDELELSAAMDERMEWNRWIAHMTWHDSVIKLLTISLVTIWDTPI